VFGMGTGVTLLPLSPEILRMRLPIDSLASLALSLRLSSLSLCSRQLLTGLTLTSTACSALSSGGYSRFPPRLLPHPDNCTFLITRMLYSLAWSQFFSLCNQALDLLVSSSSRITAFTPMTYHLVVLQGSYSLSRWESFLRLASRLDAFSVYPFHTSLPCYAVGTTTVAPVVCPFRSSRTRNSSSHDSSAHDG
jgi:hypothetical protein